MAHIQEGPEKEVVVPPEKEAVGGPSQASRGDMLPEDREVGGEAAHTAKVERVYRYDS